MTGVQVWVDGRLVDPAAASISAVDHGLTVGDGVFETLKVVDGVPFARRRHAARLQRSLAGMGLIAVCGALGAIRGLLAARREALDVAG